MKRKRSAPKADIAEPVVELVVDEIGARGDGIGRHDGRRVFVPLAMPGERVRAKLGRVTAEGVAARLVEVIEPSPQRRKAPCRHFSDADRCGGCTLQQLEAAAYLDWKREQVGVALARHGLDASVVEPVEAAEPETRRRAALAALKRSGRVTLGFNERQSHRIFDLQSCLVLEPAITKVLPDLRAALMPALGDGDTADVSISLLEGGLDVLLTLERPPKLAALEALAAFADGQDVARLSWQKGAGGSIEPLAHRRHVWAQFGGVRVAVTPGSFRQATAAGEGALVRAVLDGIGSAHRVVDLFAGSGTFSLPVANSGGREVHAVEGDPQAIDALAAAARSSRLTVTTERRDLFRNPLSPAELAGYDAAVFDPPRAGARAQAEMLAQSGLERLVAVSCNPGTFARDARLLVDGGYRLDRVLPVDQFLWSAHIEIVGNFKRLK